MHKLKNTLALLACCCFNQLVVAALPVKPSSIAAPQAGTSRRVGTSGSAQSADKLRTPAKGSAERQAIMDALRDKFKTETAAQDVVFKVDYLKVHRGWAWIDATPLDAQGQPLVEGGKSLLHFDGAKWNVIDLSLIQGYTDDPMGAEDASRGFIKSLRRKYADVPVDIFNSRAH